MNTVQLIGRLTRDPELRFTPSGTATCTIRLAVPRRKKDGAEPAPDYLDVVTFGPQAEAVASFMEKGRQVAVVGRLSHQEWTDDDGAKHSRLQVVANSVDFLVPTLGSVRGSNRRNALILMMLAAAAACRLWKKPPRGTRAPSPQSTRSTATDAMVVGRTPTDVDERASRLSSIIWLVVVAMTSVLIGSGVRFSRLSLDTPDVAAAAEVFSASPILVMVSESDEPVELTLSIDLTSESRPLMVAANAVRANGEPDDSREVALLIRARAGGPVPSLLQLLTGGGFKAVRATGNAKVEVFTPASGEATDRDRYRFSYYLIRLPAERSANPVTRRFASAGLFLDPSPVLPSADGFTVFFPKLRRESTLGGLPPPFPSTYAEAERAARASLLGGERDLSVTNEVRRGFGDRLLYSTPLAAETGRFARVSIGLEDGSVVGAGASAPELGFSSNNRARRSRRYSLLGGLCLGIGGSLAASILFQMPSAARRRRPSVRERGVTGLKS